MKQQNSLGEGGAPPLWCRLGRHRWGRWSALSPGEDQIMVTEGARINHYTMQWQARECSQCGQAQVRRL